MKPIFRSAMFGFNKEDVANFIAQQSKIQEQKLREAAQESEAVREECDLARDELERAKEELFALKEKNAAKNDVLSSLGAFSEELKQESEQLSQALQEEASLVEQLGKDMEQLHDQLRVAESYREKAKKFDRLAGVLSEIVSGQTEGGRAACEEISEESAAVYFGGAQLALERIEKQKEATARLLACYEKILALAAELDFEA